GGDTIFTWDYARTRDALSKLYEKAKRSQWNASDDLDWSIDVDQEAVAAYLATTNPETVILKQKAAEDRACPIHTWTDTEFRRLAFEQQAWMLSQFMHGEQGAL